MLFISRDTCSDSIAKVFCACLNGVSHNHRDMLLLWGTAQMCLCETKVPRGVSHHIGGVLTSLKRDRAIWGIAAKVPLRPKLLHNIHFSPFTCCFRRFFRRSFTGSFRNENAEFTQSLLCSLFTKFTGECNHSHVHSLFTANGSSECSSIHVSIGDTKTAQFIENKQTNRSGKGGRITMRCRGFIPITNHANDHYSLSSVHSEWFTNHSNHIHIFTPITRIVSGR